MIDLLLEDHGFHQLVQSINQASRAEQSRNGHDTGGKWFDIFNTHSEYT